MARLKIADVFDKKNLNRSSALHEETKRQHLFSELLVNSRVLGRRTDQWSHVMSVS